MVSKKCVARLGVIVCAGFGFLHTYTIAQDKPATAGWSIYAPVGSSFSLKVPKPVSSAQGYIFDPADNGLPPIFIKLALTASAFNFEIHRDGKRHFLASVLDVKLSKKRASRYVSLSEARAIQEFIGDDIVSSRMATENTRGALITRWTYRKKGGSGDDDEDDGQVYIKASRERMIIIVVAHDFAKPGDKEVDLMLESLTIK